VQPFPYAVADRNGKLALHLSPGHTNHSIVEGFTDSNEACEVEAVSLDSFLAQRGIGSVDFIKIDVEGAEPLVLAGLRETIARSPRLNMLIEMNPARPCARPDIRRRSWLPRCERQGSRSARARSMMMARGETSRPRRATKSSTSSARADGSAMPHQEALGSSLIPRPSSLVPHPSSLIPHPSEHHPPSIPDRSAHPPH
jgi:hypothetical protein